MSHGKTFDRSQVRATNVQAKQLWSISFFHRCWCFGSSRCVRFAPDTSLQNMQVEHNNGKNMFVGARLRLHLGGLASYAVAGTRKDYASYYAFTFADAQHNKTELVAGCCFAAAPDGHERHFVLLELRQGGQHYQLEAVGYERANGDDDDNDEQQRQLLVLDDQSTLMQPRAITQLLDESLSEAERKQLKTWCDDRQKYDVAHTLYREMKPTATALERTEQYKFQRACALLVAHRYGIALPDVIATLEEEQHGKKQQHKKKREEEQQRKTDVSRKKMRVDEDTESEEVAVQALLDVPTVVSRLGRPKASYVFEDRTFATLGELTAHCSRECARLRHEMQIQQVAHTGALQLHQFERAKWQESLKPQLESAYLKGRLEGMLNKSAELETPTFQSMFGAQAGASVNAV